MQLRKLAGFACALTLAAPAGMALTSDDANAAVVYQKCTKVAGYATITPGLTTVPQNVTIKAYGNLTGCTPAGATGGSGRLVGTLKQSGASCQKLAQGGTFAGTQKTTWKNGKTSAGTFKGVTTSNQPTTAAISGKVTSGLFVTRLINGKIRFTPGSGNCTAASPIKRLTFTSTYDGANHPLTFHS